MKANSTPKKGAPLLVKSGSAAVKIYRSKNRGGDLFTVAYVGPDGRRARQNYADLNRAKDEAQAAANRIQNGQSHALNLTGADRGLYLRALDLLKPVGEPLDLAVGQYAEAYRLLGGSGTVIEAARHFAKQHPVKFAKRTVPEVYEEFVTAKRSEGAKPRYVEDIRSRLGRFAGAFPASIGEITAQEIEGWLDHLGTGPVARNGSRALVVTLFNFAKQRGLLAKGHPTEAEAVTKVKEPPTDIGIFTPVQMIQLLEAAEDKFVAFLALGAFAGLRHAELMRLDWRDVKLDQGHIEITANKAKTAQRRIIPVQANLESWLRPHAAREGVVFRGSGTRFLSNVTKLAAKCGFPWPHNGLRHSFASYRLAQCKSAAELALEMGNTPQMVFQNYRELVTPADAVAWWNIAPLGGR